MTSPARGDLHATRQAIALGQTSARAEMQTSIDIARSGACESVFYRLDADSALLTAQSCSPGSPLAGLAVGIKDLFDVAGQVTAAGSKVLAERPAARADAPAVARLRGAGGALLGRTAMNEFAFSGMGLNPHFGTPRNPLDAAVHRLPGGSSSGAGVAVATGAVFIGLGSDTGGSVRIPAAVCGVVGFKPTTGIIPTTGAVPLSTTLDTVGPLARSVRDAVLAFELLSATRIHLEPSLKGLRVGVPRNSVLDSLDASVATAFERALSRLSAAGAVVDVFDLPELAELAPLQQKAGFSSCEGLAWHVRQGSWSRRSEIDPRVVARMTVAEQTRAVDYLELVHQRQSWIARTCAKLVRFDVLASPTVPITARPVADVLHDDAAFFATNALMLRNTAPANFLGGPAISIPMQLRGELGAGLMLWGAPHTDAAVLSAALETEKILTF